MGRIIGIRIKNYGSLKDIKLGKLLFDSKDVKRTYQYECNYRTKWYREKVHLRMHLVFLADSLEKKVLKLHAT